MLTPKAVVSGLTMAMLLLGSATIGILGTSGSLPWANEGESDPNAQQAIWYDDDCDDPKNDLSGCRGS